MSNNIVETMHKVIYGDSNKSQEPDKEESQLQEHTRSDYSGPRYTDKVNIPGSFLSPDDTSSIEETRDYPQYTTDRPNLLRKSVVDQGYEAAEAEEAAKFGASPGERYGTTSGGVEGTDTRGGQIYGQSAQIGGQSHQIGSTGAPGPAYTGYTQDSTSATQGPAKVGPIATDKSWSETPPQSTVKATTGTASGVTAGVPGQGTTISGTQTQSTSTARDQMSNTGMLKTTDPWSAPEVQHQPGMNREIGPDDTRGLPANKKDTSVPRQMGGDMRTAGMGGTQMTGQSGMGSQFSAMSGTGIEASTCEQVIAPGGLGQYNPEDFEPEFGDMKSKDMDRGQVSGAAYGQQQRQQPLMRDTSSLQQPTGDQRDLYDARNQPLGYDETGAPIIKSNTTGMQGATLGQAPAYEELGGTGQVVTPNAPRFDESATRNNNEPVVYDETTSHRRKPSKGSMESRERRKSVKDTVMGMFGRKSTEGSVSSGSSGEEAIVDDEHQHTRGKEQMRRERRHRELPSAPFGRRMSDVVPRRPEGKNIVFDPATGRNVVTSETDQPDEMVDAVRHDLPESVRRTLSKPSGFFARQQEEEANKWMEEQAAEDERAKQREMAQPKHARRHSIKDFFRKSAYLT